MLTTAIAAATANFLWCSGHVPGVIAPKGSAVSLNVDTAIVLLTLGTILALPLDRLVM